METKSFFNTPRIHYYFLDNPLSELTLQLLGYNDFQHLRGAKIPFSQDFYTLHLVVGGEGELSYKGRTYQLSQGDMFLLPPKELFHYYPSQNNPWDYIFFEFNGSKIQEILQSTYFTKDNPVAHCNNLNEILPFFKNFFEMLKTFHAGSLFEAMSLFFNLLHSARSVSLKEIQSDPYGEALVLIRLNFMDPYYTVEQLANELHCSHSQLCRYFKRKTGKTVIAHINDFRINYAKDLLCRTNLSATQIAQMSGFNEYVYFLSLFKRKTGLTTSEYRAKHNAPKLEQSNP